MPLEDSIWDAVDGRYSAAKLYDERFCPLKDKKPSIRFRRRPRKHEGLYTGAGGFRVQRNPKRGFAIQESVNTRRGVERVSDMPSNSRAKRKRTIKLTLVRKTNV